MGLSWQIKSDYIKIEYDNMLGDGTYGEVFQGSIVAGDYAGTRIVAKRAKDWEGRVCA